MSMFSRVGQIGMIVGNVTGEIKFFLKFNKLK